MATKKKTSRTTRAAKASPSKRSKTRASTSAPSQPAPDAETRRLQTIVDVFARSDLAELEYEDKDICLKLSRYPQASAAMPATAQPSLTALPPAAPAGPTPAGPAPASEPAPAPGPSAEAHLLKSPFVGTFYRAPSPEAPSFTEVGQRVSKGQTVCIIEAMKLMNEIPSDVDGRIASVLVENGEPVQFGDPLFEITVK
jgi:acetyl-CoA carboxylase biotin carboxyl carrier protein